MGSKAILLLGLLLAVVLLISSEVAAKELLTETSNVVDTSNATNGVVDHGVNAEERHYKRRYKRRYKKREKRRVPCHYGCCKKLYKGGCLRCCYYAGEKADAGQP